ncbi:hypothetical protein SAMN04515666_11939 [Bosea lupini]|uniref:Uncharacterized protein n=1 Tax=Bosea lupini TaxID=1036779 RepID=A0A1H8AF09_9HYPH|nr:hypothetical protein [Bosea lupini]SEM69432.1 hypothetical protein SAMN04515666_11939 [Bosea lupini]
MKTDNGLAIALFALIMGGAVALAIASDIAAPLCEVARSASKEAQKPYIGCLEFWLERYQSLAGGLLALGGALGTIGIMRWQSLAAERASERVARAYVYGRLKDFLAQATLRLDAELVAPSKTRNVPLPSFDLGENFSIVGHLPRDLARDVFQFRTKTVGIESNRESLRTMGAVSIERYAIAAIARRILDADALCQEVASQLGLYTPTFDEFTAVDLTEKARPFDQAVTFEAVIDWIFAGQSAADDDWLRPT